MAFPFHIRKLTEEILGQPLGILLDAFVVAKFAASNNTQLALGVGAFFLLGGRNIISMPSHRSVPRSDM